MDPIPNGHPTAISGFVCGRPGKIQDKCTTMTYMVPDQYADRAELDNASAMGKMFIPKDQTV